MKDKISITSLSSRGQVVIPLTIREKLNLEEGEKFIVAGDDDVVILKKIELPKLSDIDKLIPRRKS